MGKMVLKVLAGVVAAILLMALLSDDFRAGFNEGYYNQVPGGGMSYSQQCPPGTAPAMVQGRPGCQPMPGGGYVSPNAAQMPGGYVSPQMMPSQPGNNAYLPSSGQYPMQPSQQYPQSVNAPGAWSQSGGGMPPGQGNGW
ncbi:MAG: hypothetical protein H6993_04845 [Pseudomonadales bacterium]|nr:hypothetical protein [Pseudomonadales bacterium]MCP5183266.1 hypothetical protein [Pseudomonadales bacterium]